MVETDIMWPSKTREVVNAYMDSTVWNRFAFRDGDIVIANWGKSGCTWLQQIVAQLILGGSEREAIAGTSPWLEFPIPSHEETLALLDQQTHRRFIKTHLPVDALVYSPRAKYVYIGRDGRDIVWSLFQHFKHLSDVWYESMHAKRGRFGPLPSEPPADFPQFLRDWLERDGYPWWPFWSHVRSWWAIRDLPNLLMLHYAELTADLPSVVRRLAAFLAIDLPEGALPLIVEHCSFAYMKEHAEQMIRGNPRVFDGGPKSFFDSGRNGGWRNALEAFEAVRFEQHQAHNLPPDCVRWLQRS